MGAFEAAVREEVRKAMADEGEATIKRMIGEALVRLGDELRGRSGPIAPWVVEKPAPVRRAKAQPVSAHRAAKEIGRHVTWVYRLIQGGELESAGRMKPARSLPGAKPCLHVTRESLEKYIASGSPSPRLSPGKGRRAEKKASGETMTAKEAAEYLGVSSRTIYAHTHEGKLERAKGGGVTTESVERYAEARTADEPSKQLPLLNGSA